ncbi:MAG: ABC transporter permease subunit [Lachnospiraceae bacterium]|nr:ABC transporter permease subunit [Lachnospiraceae bacterium]
MIHRILEDKICRFCLVFLLIFTCAALFAPWIAPNDPNEIHYTARFAKISREFPLGTDYMGRCILSRLLHGARLSLGSAAGITIVSSVLGTLLGMISGYVGGRFDRVLMGVCDAVRAFPGMVIVLVSVGILGTGLLSLCLGMMAVRWVWYTKVTRNLTRAERKKEVVLASAMAGSSTTGILFGLIFPAIRIPILAVATLQFGTALTALAGYSFLGFGAAPPSPEWGMMIQDGRSFISTNPSMLFWPGFCILMVIIVTNILGDRMQEMFELVRK